MSPQCRTKRSTAAGSFTVFSVFSVMTEISEMKEAMSRGLARRISGGQSRNAQAASRVTLNMRGNGLQPAVPIGRSTVPEHALLGWLPRLRDQPFAHARRRGVEQANERLHLARDRHARFARMALDRLGRRGDLAGADIVAHGFERVRSAREGVRLASPDGGGQLGADARHILEIK